MKIMARTLLGLVLPAVSTFATAETNPISKVLQMLSDLQSKIIKDGQEAQKAYEQFAEFCDDRFKELGFEIKTGKSEAEELEAAIAKATSLIGSYTAKTEELAASIASDEADLKAASEIRAKENADFMKEEKDLTEVIDMLERAVSILEREMQKGGASMLQMQNAGGVAQALSALVQASALSAKDGAKLSALVQSTQLSEETAEEDSLQAPAAAVYEGQSGDIITTLEGLKDKAAGNLADARKKETNALHNFEMLKQSLEDDIKYATKDMEQAKKSVAESSESKATSEGDLVATRKGIKSDTTALADLKQDCMTKAQDFEAATKSRGDELGALAKAKTVIAETTGNAEKFTYGLSQTSFLQISRSQLSSGADLAKFEAVRFVRDLARKQHSSALAQLAARMAVAVRAGSSNGQDPFAKVKGLLSDMISRLMDEADADATHEAYCDKEMAESTDKNEDKTTIIEKLSTKIDQATTRSAQLKEEVSALQKALSDLAAAQADMDKLRQSESAEFAKNKNDLDAGLEGVKLGLKTLREYYAKDAAAASNEGAGDGIISLLEVVESDLSKSIAGIVAAEETAGAAYKAETKENGYEKEVKEKDVELKIKESTRLDKAVAEMSSERAGEQAELDAVLEYIASLKKQCIVQPDTYAERKASREAEMAGLKEALSILDGEAVLLQSGVKRALRGNSRA